MIRYNRRNTIWLGILGALVGLVLVSSQVAPLIQAMLVMIFALAAAASFIDTRALNSRRTLIKSIQQRSPLNRTRLSPQAREAVARASTRGGYQSQHLALADIGMIASQSGADGMVMRRTRTISKDDDGVRPFITLYVDPTEADRNATVRFEIIDQNGRDQYVHEMKVFVRDGEVNILADHHLPLMKNPQIEGMGDWDLRVYVDGKLLGVHNFALAPSDEQRRSRLSRQYYVTEPERDQDVPMSLEDLLRNQTGTSTNRNH
jgi:hypothetical protein